MMETFMNEEYASKKKMVEGGGGRRHLIGHEFVTVEHG